MFIHHRVSSCFDLGSRQKEAEYVAASQDHLRVQSWPLLLSLSARLQSTVVI